jgi:carbonic anhydrase
MEKLVRGIRQFQTTEFNAHRELFKSLSQGQRPETLLITCSDSRIAPELLMQAQPGDLFVLRNAGNLIPLYGAANGGGGATVEYAVAALGVKHALVMGHSNCGAMKGLLDPESLAGMPLVSEWHADEGDCQRARLDHHHCFLRPDRVTIFRRALADKRGGRLTDHGRGSRGVASLRGHG